MVMIIKAILLLISSSSIIPAASYNTSLAKCGSPSRPMTTPGYECTGVLFSLVDINGLNTLKTEQGCVAVMLGFSTQLKGYHCLAVKDCPGSGCTCEVRQGCSSSSTSSNTTKACLYGVNDIAECPADVPVGAPMSASVTCQCNVLVFLVIAICCLLADASSNPSLSLCGSPSNPKTTSGYACAGALFTALDINTLNPTKSEAGCVAALVGISTQLKGYHCVAMKNCPGSSCTCEVRQGCSSAAANDNSTKSCLYGVQDVTDCPADEPIGAPISSAISRFGSVLIGTSVALIGSAITIAQ